MTDGRFQTNVHERGWFDEIQAQRTNSRYASASRIQHCREHMIYGTWKTLAQFS